ncbi:hypothetical protein AA0114_g2398 [Alternaria tenuissima]|uniref:Rhodopsin domain-containing protein n=1 Tax=Alternaria tenuissima TaxID=119927 RepID=A0A4Q4MR80_9PLEO|nr:hypothetical protein AA0114_g2398 [Alternaria tenuissima]
MGQVTQDICVGVSTALTILSIICVALRLYTRTFIVQHTGKDDYAMVFALLFTVAYLVAIFILRDNGMGFSGEVLELQQMLNQIQATLAIEIVYYLIINAIKISILFFYLRIAVEKRFEYLCKGTIYFLVTFGVVCVIVCLAQCVPLHKMWDLAGQVSGQCINTTAFFYTTSAVNIIADIWILLLPINTLLKVQRPRREKFALVVIFSLGAFSCIASIVRLYSVDVYTESEDPFFDSVPINVWSMVEINVGILCASIPATKALFSKAQRHRTHNGSYQYHSRERSIMKSYGHGSGKSNSNNGQEGTAGGPTGAVIQNESYELKDVESGDHQPFDARKQNGGGGAWRVPDSDVDEQRLVWPESRV